MVDDIKPLRLMDKAVVAVAILLHVLEEDDLYCTSYEAAPLPVQFSIAVDAVIKVEASPDGELHG